MTSPLEQCRDALRRLTGAAFPVSTEIDGSGYAWSHAYLDSALPGARAALAAADSALAAQPEPSQWQIWCDCCEGTGNVHQESQRGVIGSGGTFACPDCDGNGYRLKSLYAAPVAQGWVPMDERLPPEGVRVLVYVPTCDLLPIQADEWNEQREDPLGMGGPTVSTGHGWDEHEFEEVTHWMPLPAAPKEPA